MSDEVEKFVLQYNVELKDSIQKLNALHEKMEQANKKGSDGAKEISGHVKEAVGHLDKLVPGLSDVADKSVKIGGAIKGWAPQIIVATAAMTALAYAIKQVNLLRAEYAEQRITAWNTGQSPLGVEQTQRELTAASGGRLTGAQGRSLMENIQSKLQAAYTDPNPNNETNLRLQMAGTSAYGGNGQIKSVTSALDEIGNKMRHVSQEQANAIGQTLGLTQNETQALMNRNQAVIESQKLSDDEVKRRTQANAAMESLNSSFGSIDESMRQTGNVIGEEFMPIFAEVMKVVSDWLSGLPGNVDKAITAFTLFNKTFELFMEDIQDPKKVFTGQVSWEKSQQAAADSIAKQNAAARAAADKQGDAAQTQKETAANNEKAIRLFSQSVNTMAGVVDEQQAWAAWAGSVGQAAGLRGMGSGAAGVAQASGGGNGQQYGGYSSPAPDGNASTSFNTGNIRSSAGGFRTFNNYQDGMSAQANQLRRYYDGKTTGRKLQSINDIIATWAPNNENNTSAYIKYMSDKMKMRPDQKLDFSDSNILGEFMYYQAMYEKGGKNLKGLSMSDFKQAAANRGTQNGSVTPVNKNDPAMSSVYGSEGQNNGVHASTRENIRLNEVFASVAGYIGGGMTTGQMRNGGASKADIRWGLNKDMFETQRNVATLQQQLSGPQLEKNRAEYETQLLRAEQHLQALRTNYNTVLGVGRGDANGPRSITIQRPEYNVIIQGAPDPHATAQAVSKVLQGATNDIVNNANSAVSH